MNESCLLGFIHGSTNRVHRVPKTASWKCGRTPSLSRCESLGLEHSVCKITAGQQCPRCQGYSVTSLKRILTVSADQPFSVALNCKPQGSEEKEGHCCSYASATCLSLSKKKTAQYSASQLETITDPKTQIHILALTLSPSNWSSSLSGSKAAPKLSLPKWTKVQRESPSQTVNEGET